MPPGRPGSLPGRVGSFPRVREAIILRDADDLPNPDEIAEDLRAAVAQIEEILGDLQGSPAGG